MTDMIKGVVQGYKPQVDWGGESGSATIVVGQHNVTVATSGWRRRCLFTLLVVLLFISFVNFLLTLWIIKCIKFNAEGVGALQIENGGVTLKGKSILGGKVTTSKIQGHPEKDLTLKGYHNVSFINMEEDGNVTSSMVLHERGLKVDSSKFEVKSPSGETLFGIDNEGMTSVSEAFKVLGDGKADFEGSMMTPKLLGEDIEELRLESPTRSIKGEADDEVLLEARDGTVRIQSMSDVRLSSGAVKLETPHVFLPQVELHGPMHKEDLISNDPNTRIKTRSRPQARYLPTDNPLETQIKSPEVKTPPPTQPTIPKETGVLVFQVCVCPSGRLFLTDAEANCQPDEYTCR